ncbi:hypothetical protein ACRAWG_27400 [Methylobacterium sp. P31]
MGLSEAEIEARLAALRRRREALDREIADLVLYLELGRRLGAAGTVSDAPAAPGAGEVLAPRSGAEPGRDAASPPPARTGRPPVEAPVRHESPIPGPLAESPCDGHGASGPIPPAIAFTEDAAGARRYGRALVQAACGAITEAGRPLHAAEILEILLARGFTLPGRDPVAALNTRLWKRAGPGGPLRRVGEATYAVTALPEAGTGLTGPGSGPVTKT